MRVTDERQQRRFETMIVPNLDDALSLARWLTGNAADAEDVVQEACLRAFNAIDACDDQKARAWLLAIVRNCAFTWMGRNRPKAVIVTDDTNMLEQAVPVAHAEIMTPETELIAKADKDMLHQAIARLPTGFRETLVLREFNDCSYREIADIVHVPVGTVMSRLARARALLMTEVARLQSETGSRP